MYQAHIIPSLYALNRKLFFVAVNRINLITKKVENFLYIEKGRERKTGERENINKITITVIVIKKIILIIIMLSVIIITFSLL